jgi:hypothetical protein
MVYGVWVFIIVDDDVLMIDDVQSNFMCVVLKQFQIARPSCDSQFFWNQAHHSNFELLPDEIFIPIIITQYH